MARFKFYMSGSAQPLVLEVGPRDISELHDAMARSRFVQGEIVETEDGTTPGVLIATSRIQLVMDADG